MDFPDEYHNGNHVMLDSEQLGTVRWEKVDVYSDVTVHQLQRLTILPKDFERIGFRHVN